VTANLVYDQPKTPQQAQFSLPFAIGCMLTHGDVSLAQLDPAVLEDPALAEAMSRVTTVTTGLWQRGGEKAQLYPEGAHVTVTTRDGRSFEHFNGFARGTTARPLTDAEIAGKFMGCASGAIGQPEAERLIGQLHALETLPSVRSLFGGA
jgi:2-methylcitrate dehydratase PrpD